jgi:hypothetical protein
VDDLRLTSAPAFVLLGVEPTTVQHPTSPKALTTTLVSFVNGPDGIPRNFALEVTPYWLRARPAFTATDYFRGSQLARTASFALATSPTTSTAADGAGETQGTAIAGSFRTMLVSPGIPAGYEALVATTERKLGECAVDPATVEACFARIAENEVARLRDLIVNPPGFSLELAAGGSGESTSGAAEDLRWRRAGVWLTPTYRLSGMVDLLAVARAMRERGGDDEEDRTLLDYGARLRLRASRDLALSAELVGRRYGGAGAEGSDRTTRYGGLLEYRATNDLFVFYAFGKDFAAADAPRSRLLSSLGLSLGFGNGPQIRIR